ncbi:MAG: sigma-54-dependent Fis family transcriptional regulator [Planctomycetia bacterium]|jgi:DNA-binding NtrC family response regulator|nr:sigma-54-dependent Fis family transcriptional regulator [Planctomycetia bacterium]MCC7316551.1 sigma-54-dependent Fis family transcriptional regulator [Planctomycetota bacterium]OQZ06024.1 MAG: sigma-54-dependent Fis family transcriptional regulator [Planctomycetes bacterium UTPLA1]
MTNQDRILVVDDSVSTLKVLERNLVTQGYVVFTAQDVANAVELLESTSVDLVVTDLRMPRIGGLDLIRHVRSNLPDTGVIMITGFASIGSAVSAMREGAEDYLPKPFTDEELIATVQGALEKVHARRAAKAPAAEMHQPPHGLIGDSSAMRQVFDLISRAAVADATVLISGESGTGKELVARAIHYGGTRASGPFVPVNCAGIPEGLVESELFGHVKGAFTSATSNRAGLFAAADEGTIFLDEIGELAPSAQAKLLRVLQEQEVQMVGADRSRAVNVRVIAATNKDLGSMVERGAFREDLFYRLYVVTIDLPSLRERDDDVLLLAHYFLERFSKQAGRPVPRLTDRAIESLRAYSWPGNVRELQNLIQRLIVMTDGDTIDATALPLAMRFTVPRERGLQRSLDDVEREHINAVLATVGGNKTRAAEILGIDRKTLREKLKNYKSL